MTNLFIYYFCINYPKYTYYLKILNQICPEMLFYFSLSIFCISYIVIFFMLFNTFNYYKKNFQYKFNEKNLEFFANFEKKKQGICILMPYKINNIYRAFLETFVLFVFFIMIFVVMRLSKLEKTLNIKDKLNNYLTLPLIIKIILIILILMFIICLRFLYLNITLRFYFLLKQWYVYMHKYGTYLDPKAKFYTKYNDPSNMLQIFPYIEKYLFNYIERLSPFTWHRIIAIFCEKNEYNIFIKDYNDRQPLYIFIPFIYFFKFSKYKDSYFSIKSKVFFNVISDNFYMTLLLTPWIFFIIYFCMQFYFNNGVINHFYYILLLIFCYNQYIYLCDFLYSVSSIRTIHICMYYYVKINPESITSYDYIINKVYTRTTIQEKQDEYLIYVLSGFRASVVGKFLRKESLNNDPKFIIILKNILEKLYKLQITKMFLKFNRKYFEIK